MAETEQRQARQLSRYRDLVSAAVFVFFLWAYYKGLGWILLWVGRELQWSNPDFESAAMFLSLPFLAAVWVSHYKVMDWIDSLD